MRGGNLRRFLSALALGVLVCGCVAAGAAPSSVRAKRPLGLRLKVKRPAAGDVVVAKFVVRIKRGARLSRHPKLVALNKKRLPRSLVSVGAVKSLGKRRFAILIAAVNPKPAATYGGSSATRGSEGDALSFIFEYLASGGQPTVNNVKVTNNPDDPIGLGQISKLVLWDIVVPDVPPPDLEAKPTPDQIAHGDLFDLAGPHVNAKSVFEDIVDLAEAATKEDAATADEKLAKLERDTGGGQLVRPLYRFSFGHLRVDYDSPPMYPPNASQRQRHFFDIAGGSACGNNPVKIPWTVTGTRAIYGDFSTTFDFSKNPADVQAIAYYSGSTERGAVFTKVQLGRVLPEVDLVVETRGDIVNVTKNPATTPLSVTRVASCA